MFFSRLSSPLQLDLFDYGKKYEKEQLLRYFNYSPNFNDNLVTLS